MMKKNKLYTVNKWNQPAFISAERNIFWPGGNLTGSLSANNPSDFWGINSAINSPLPTTLSPQANQALGANLAKSAGSSVAKGIGSSLGNVGLGIAGSVGNKALKGLIGGDLESGAGNAIADIGNSVGGLVSNIPGIGTLGGMAIQLGTGAIGGLVNRAFGSKLNEENIANVKNKSGEITKQGSLSAGAQSNEDVIGNWGNADLSFNFNKDYIGKDGWFSSKAADKFDEMQRLLGTAKRSAVHGLEMGVHNADTNQDNNVASNFIYALGGNMFNKGGKKFRGKKMPYITHYNSYRNNSIDAMRKAGFTDEEIDDWNINVNHTSGYKRLSDGKIATEPVGGVFGGGEFTGSGATERWTPAYIPSSNASFNEAYDEAREAGAETFMFGDKEYNTLREANPIREFNNRYVGAGRTEESVRQREGYGKDFGPVRGPLAGIPLITYAYGGPIDSMDGAIGYGFMSDYLLSKNKTAENKNQMTNMFIGMPNSMFAFGGDMQTNSADFPTGLTHIGAGGSHEENPNDGVQMGVDENGTPNLVEENETIFNDYVFSNRILADEATKQMFKLPKKKDVTFAEISKKLEKEIAERPNDPISKAGFKAQMQTLEEQQERQKSEMEAERARAAFEALSPEEQTAVMQNAVEQEAMAQQAAQEQAVAEQQTMQQPSPEEAAMMQQQMQEGAMPQEQMIPAEEGYAYGGNLFDYGGALKWLKEKHPDVGNKEQIAKVLSKRAKKIGTMANSREVLYDYKTAFEGMIAPNKPIGKDNDTLFESLVRDGMERKAAFGLAYPQTLGYPYNGNKYKTSHDAARNVAYKKYITDYKHANKTEKAAQTTTVQPQTDNNKVAAPKQETPKVSAEGAPVVQQEKIQRPLKAQTKGSAVSQDKGINVGKFKQEGNHWNEYGLPGLQNYLLNAEASLNDPDITDARRDEIRQGIVDTLNGVQESYYTNIAPTLGKNRQNKSAKVEQHQRMYQNATNNAGFYGVDEDGRYYNKMDMALDKPEGHNTTDNLATGWVDGYSGPQTWLRHMGASGDSLNDVVEQLRNIGIDYSPYNNWTVGEGDNARQLYRASIINPDSSIAEVLPDPYEEGWEERRGILPADEQETEDSFVEVDENGNPIDQRNIVPIHRNEKLRYAGLFGPAVGLGMQLAGIGKPDTASLDAAIKGAGDVHLAEYQPLGNYLTYRPLDIWYEQNALNEQSRATDRALLNSSSPSRMAGLIANGYNTQLASGNLFRQAQEYNDSQRKQVAEFNRGTDQYNSGQFGATSRFNADAMNRANQYSKQLALHAAAQKMNADASWNRGIYGNVSGIFKGLADLGRENYQYNQMVDLLNAGVIPGVTEEKLVGSGLARYSAEGGKIKKKKNKKRGLTF